MSDSISIPAEGTLFRSQKTTGYMLIHSCSIAGHPDLWTPDTRGGGVSIFKLSEEDSVLHCHNCGMRTHVPAYCTTWEQLVEYFS